MKYQWTPGWTQGTECYESLELWSLFAGRGASFDKTKDVLTEKQGPKFPKLNHADLPWEGTMLVVRLDNCNRNTTSFNDLWTNIEQRCWVLSFHPKFVRIWRDLLICCFLLEVATTNDIEYSIFGWCRCSLRDLETFETPPKMPWDDSEGVSEGTPRAWAREGQDMAWIVGYLFIKYHAVCKEDW